MGDCDEGKHRGLSEVLLGRYRRMNYRASNAGRVPELQTLGRNT